MKINRFSNDMKVSSAILIRDDGSIFLGSDANATWLNFYDKGKWNDCSWLLGIKSKIIGDRDEG